MTSIARNGISSLSSPIHRSAWKRNSANFAFWGFSEDEMRRPTLNAVPYGLQILVTGSYAQ
jgi:hypothetical protein